MLMNAAFTAAPVQQRGDLTVPIVAALFFGLATLVVLSKTGGSIAVSMTELTVIVNGSQ
jgi:hypothetical protein